MTDCIDLPQSLNAGSPGVDLMPGWGQNGGSGQSKDTYQLAF